jgi:predicted kinase
MEQAQLVSDEERLIESLGQLPEPVARPIFIAVSGLPGTGKSYFCSKLADRLPFVVLESDALRKTIIPVPTYTTEESARLFRAVHRLIEQLLNKGISLILDATNLSERHREYLYNIADRLDIKLVLVRVNAPPEVVQARLIKRVEESGGKSDADLTVYQRMKNTVEEISRKHYAVDTSRDITPVLDKIVKEVTR